MVIILYLNDINDDNKDIISKFLNNIESISNIDYDILNNGIAVINEEKQICGYITYEKFSEYGLIRYFIYQKNVDFEYIKQMYLELIKKAFDDEIESFISIGNNNDVVNIFKQLNFHEIEFSNFIVNDRLLYGTEFENTIIMKNEFLWKRF